MSSKMRVITSANITMVLIMESENLFQDQCHFFKQQINHNIICLRFRSGSFGDDEWRCSPQSIGGQTETGEASGSTVTRCFGSTENDWIPKYEWGARHHHGTQFASGSVVEYGRVDGGEFDIGFDRLLSVSGHVYASWHITTHTAHANLCIK